MSLVNSNWLGTNFLLENGKGYIIYSSSDKQQLILQETLEQKPSISLIPGASLVNILDLEDYTLPGHTSFRFLQEQGKEDVQSISRYNQKKGVMESSYRFFGRPTGKKFSIKPNEAEAYLIMSK